MCGTLYFRTHLNFLKISYIDDIYRIQHMLKSVFKILIN